ncbi:hypothetical protein QZH41_013764 [Actinostola sp. cb2023]|nr:hypothetical protein QZH41_013764 [Actinostola sp. cb2023]
MEEDEEHSVDEGDSNYMMKIDEKVGSLPDLAIGQEDEKTKQKEKKKRKENIKVKDEEHTVDANDGSSMTEMDETVGTQQGIANGEDTEKTKRKEKKKRKENIEVKEEEHTVDANDGISMTEMDETVGTQQGIARGEDTKETKRKEKKKRKEKLKKKNLEHSIEEADCNKSPDKRRKHTNIKNQPLDENTSSVDSFIMNSNDEFLAECGDDNNNEQSHKDNNGKSKTHTDVACNRVVEKENKAKHSKKNVHQDDKHSEAVNKSNKNRREKRPSVTNKQNNSNKKLASNEKRLQAIKEREMYTNTKQSIVATALLNLDKKDQHDNTKHIMFDDDDDYDDDDDDDDDEDDDGGDDEEEKELHREKQKKHTGTGKISGSKAANWLGLDVDDDESNDDITFDEQTFNAKPQFEGKAGQKLFELQKSYRGDSRFQLDKRFVDSDDDSEDEDIDIPTATQPNDDDINVDDDDDAMVSKQLSQEKSMAMSVLRGILGVNIGSKYGDGSTRNDKFKNSNSLRYDPTRDDHAQFEQKPKKDSSPEPSVQETQQSSADVMSSVPEVTSEKYYDVQTDALTEMFADKKKDEPSMAAFTFLSSQDDPGDEASATVEWGEAEVLQSKPWNPVMLPYDSSGDEQEQDDEMIDEDQQPRQDKQAFQDERFFFHFGDADLENRVYEQENVFMRTETLEQLNQHWVNTRSELTQDYKKKHKDALRRHSKMAAKRARMR